MQPATGLAQLHAAAYTDLCPIYEARLSLLREVRQNILNRVLADIPVGATVLDVGCGNGGSLALMDAMGYHSTGMEISPVMAQAARSHSGCTVMDGDFLTLPHQQTYDVVFAQAFVHLFPKQQFPTVLAALLAIAKRRVYFSTTCEQRVAEGLELKDGTAMRYRARYSNDELQGLVKRCLVDLSWHVKSFWLTDPLGKNWINIVLTRHSDASVTSGCNPHSLPL